MLCRAVQAAVAADTWQAPELGSAECKQLFSLDPSFIYLNHGSYGSAYRLALDVQSWYREQLEREPVKFMETAGLAALVSAVADVAEFVGADWRDVVPVTNATTGVNAVLQSLKLQKGDLILIANTTYAAVSGGGGVCA
jgi:isopenicillin-N epimerase